MSPYLHKPAIIILTSFATELATTSVTDVRYVRTDTLPRLIYKHNSTGSCEAERVEQTVQRCRVQSSILVVCQHGRRAAHIDVGGRWLGRLYAGPGTCSCSGHVAGVPRGRRPPLRRPFSYTYNGFRLWWRSRGVRGTEIKTAVQYSN